MLPKTIHKKPRDDDGSGPTSVRVHQPQLDPLTVETMKRLAAADKRLAKKFGLNA